MATGYDFRPAGRPSFAPQGSAPVQSQSARRGVSNGAQVVGGNSQGQGITVGPQTAPGSIGGQLGQYFEGLMQPYLERKKKEQFIAGFTEAAHGTAIEELTSSGSPVTRIFGPTGFEEGAQFYTSQAALDTFSTDMMADMENLRKLPPAELAKAISAKSDALMTKDSATNVLIQGGLIERMGPVMKAAATARVEWQQGNAVNSMNIAHTAAATNHQQLMAALGTNPNPSDADRQAAQSYTQSFLAARGKPEGMTEASYLKYIATSTRADIVAGNFYAVEAMKTAGSWNLLDEETRTKLEIAYDTHSTKALTKAASALSPQLLALHTEIKMAAEIDTTTGQPRGFKGGAIEAMKRLADLNNQAKGMVGTTVDLFDYKDFVAEGGNLVDVIISAKRRADDRANALADMQTRRNWELEDKERDATEKAAQVTALWGIGDINAATAGGVDASNFNAIALAEARNGNYAGILRAYRNPGGSWTSPAVANMLQSAVKTAIGDEYTKEVGDAHKQWQALYKESPAAAAAYYGDMHPVMLSFDAKLRSNQSPQMAFMRSFGAADLHPATPIPENRKKSATEKIEAVIDGTEYSRWVPWGHAALSPSSRRITTDILTRRVAQLAAGDPGASDEALVKQALAAATADGSYERYGAYVIEQNKPGTRSLASLTGLQGEEMTATFSYIVARSLKRVGYKLDPEKQDTTIRRLKMPDGTPAFHVEARDPEGGATKAVLITVNDLKAYHQYQMAEQRAARTGAPADVKLRDDYEKYYEPEKYKARGPRYSGVNTHRVVPGETGWQRLKRQNREVKEGADPVNHFNK